MTIKVGDTIPSMKLMVATADGPKEISTDEIFKGKKVVLFAVPGAFTPTCSAKHLPGFVQNADALKAKGVDTIACIAVNDAFVMGAWGKDQGTGDKVTMLADGAAAFAKAIGLELDLNARGMGWRSQRYALVAEDGKVTHLGVEAPGGFEVSKAEGDPLRPVEIGPAARLAGTVWLAAGERLHRHAIVAAGAGPSASRLTSQPAPSRTYGRAESARIRGPTRG